MRSDLEPLRRELLAAWRREQGRRRKAFPEIPAEMVVDLGLSRRAQAARHDDCAVDAWIENRRNAPHLACRPVPLQALARWQVAADTGNISHETGQFFSITGVSVRHRRNNREVVWDQPIIDQPEIGILGLLVKRLDGILHVCLQAKEEPGNIGGMQLSPTVQATYSNYTQVHGGTLPPFVEHFLAPQRERILFAKLQTEDGGRFLYKSNRNMVVMLDEAAPETLPDGFIWLTLRQIANLLRRDNLIHACTRSILSALVPDSDLHNSGFDQEGSRPEPSSRDDRHRDTVDTGSSLSETLQWLDDRRSINHMLVKRVGLATLSEWAMDDEGFLAHRDHRFFRILGIEVGGDSREVPSWSQPILDNQESGIIGLLVRKRAGRREFLLQAKADVGNRPTVQLGPTVEFTPANYQHNVKLPKPFLFDCFNGGGFPVLWENRQAEEGARFYREDHLHRILLCPEGEELPLPEDFRWLTEDEVRFFLHLGETVNSCARSILACLL